MRSILFTLILFTIKFGFSQVQIGGDIDGEVAGDESGFSISLSRNGRTVAIGAGYNNDAGYGAGHTRIFQWDGVSWSQMGNDIDGDQTIDLCGSSVSLNNDGDIVAIGMPHNYSGFPGKVKAYRWNGSDWNQMGSTIFGENNGDKCGRSISLSSDGSTLAIASPFNSDSGSYTGQVRVFRWDGSQWIKKGNSIYGEDQYDFYGKVNLSGDGNILAIGSESHSGSTGLESGTVKIFEWNGTYWNQKGSDIDGEKQGDHSGISICLNDSGNVVAIGSLLNDDNGNDAGQTQVYYWSGNDWLQRGMDIEGESEGDYSGFSVSLSSDASTLAIGAMYNDDNGNDAGHTRIYIWDGISWLKKGFDLDGENAGDRSGFSTSINSNGNIVAIGAIENDGNGIDAGHVRVYRLNSTPIDTNEISICFGNSLILKEDSVDFIGWASVENPEILITQEPEFTFYPDEDMMFYSYKIEDTSLINVIVLPSPHEIGLAEDTFFCVGNQLELDVSNIEGSNYLWQDNSNSPKYNVVKEGEYSVTVSINQCSISDTINITSEECVLIDIPNIITPNNDGINDIFTPIKTKGIIEMETTIYNRWGKEIYKTNDIEIGWKPNDISDSIYFWIINYKDFLDKKNQMKGFVNIQR